MLGGELGQSQPKYCGEITPTLARPVVVCAIIIMRKEIQDIDISVAAQLLSSLRDFVEGQQDKFEAFFK